MGVEWSVVEWSVTKHGLDVEDVRCAIRRIVASQVYESGDLTKMDAVGFDRQARLCSNWSPPDWTAGSGCSTTPILRVQDSSRSC